MKQHHGLLLNELSTLTLTLILFNIEDIKHHRSVILNAWNVPDIVEGVMEFSDIKT